MLESKTGDMTVDELMTRLKTDNFGSGFLCEIWDAEDSIIELHQVFSEDADFKEEKSKLNQEIKTTITHLSRKQTKRNEMLHDIDTMSPEEVLKKLVCKCKDFTDKYSKKAELLKQLDQFNKEEVNCPFSPSSSISSDSGNLLLQSDLPQIGAHCKQFMSVKNYAISFIDEILEEAEEKVNVVSEDVPHSMEFDICGEVVGESTTESKLTLATQTSGLIDWVSYLLIEDFTPKAGKQFILNVIYNTWNIGKKWSYCINFIVENSDTCSDFYIYEVKWSLPNWKYPIPQVTVSVFFTIEVSRIKQKDCPVSITYNFETERFKFTLEDDIQHDAFLDDIMKCKLEFFKYRRN